MANSMDGQNSVLSVVGPISHSVRSLQLLVKSLLSQEPWLHDPLVHEIPWREGKATLPDKEKLAFGILRHDGAVTPHPPVRRAIELVVKALRKQGHKVIDWTPPSHARGNEIIVSKSLPPLPFHPIPSSPHLADFLQILQPIPTSIPYSS